MPPFATKHLPLELSTIAPDGSEVRVLLGLSAGGMAHFQLAPNQISKAVTHRTVEEIWYFVSGRGQMWRKSNDEPQDEGNTVDVFADVCLTIPLGTRFQFRSFGHEPLGAIAVTMPPWPGEDEAVIVQGRWEPSVK